MEPRRSLAVLWHRKWVVIATTLATTAVVIAGTLAMAPVFTASATLRMLTTVAGSVGWVDYNIEYADRLMNTYVAIATSGPVLDELQQQLDLTELLVVEAEIVPVSELIQITVEAESPETAAEAANALAEILIAQSKGRSPDKGTVLVKALSQRIDELDLELDQVASEYRDLVAKNPGSADRIASLAREIDSKEAAYLSLSEQRELACVRDAMQVNELTLVDPAERPSTSTRPKPVLNAALGVLVGLSGGIALAYLIENLAAEQTSSVVEIPGEDANLSGAP